MIQTKASFLGKGRKTTPPLPKKKIKIKEVNGCVSLQTVLTEKIPDPRFPLLFFFWLASKMEWMLREGSGQTAIIIIIIIIIITIIIVVVVVR